MSFKLTRQLDAVLFKTQVTEPLRLTVKAMGDSNGELVARVSSLWDQLSGEGRLRAKVRCGQLICD